MKETKKYVVMILGEPYALLSDESEEHIKQSAQTIDHLLREILTKTSIKEHKKAAILAALKVTSKLLRLESDRVKGEKIAHQVINMIDSQMPGVE